MAGLVATLLAGAFVVAGCAGTSASSKYPRRRPGCQLAVYHTAVPPVAAWDDIGPVEVGCHIDTSHAECLRRLYAEACRMGGDIVYAVPKHPMRPRDQVIMFSGQVAHSPSGKSAEPRKDEDGDLPPPASEEESKGPIQPLAPPVRVPPVPVPVPTRAPGTVPGASPTPAQPAPAGPDSGATPPPNP